MTGCGREEVMEKTPEILTEESSYDVIND